MSLAGPNTFGGGLTINGDGGVTDGGRVFLDNGRAAGTGIITLNGSGASLVLGAGLTVTNNFVISDTGDKKYLRAFSTGTTITGNIDIQETTQDNFELQFQQAVTISGNITGTGGAGIRKANNGKLTLTGNNTYTGETTINAGTLALSGSATIPNTTRISVGNSRTFDVSGLSSTFTLGANQTLSGNANGANLVGNINAASGNFNFPFNITNTVQNPSFKMNSGTLTMNNNPANVFVTGSALTNGSYKLIQANGGTVVGSVTTSVVTTSGAGVVAGSWASLSIVGGELFLDVTTMPTPTPESVVITSLTPTNMTLTWTQPQFRLQVQTNALDSGLSTNWVDRPGRSPVTVPIHQADPSVFYRLVFP